MMNAEERCRNDLIQLGKLGRLNGELVDSQEQLSLENGLYRVEGLPEIKNSKDYVIELMVKAGLKVRIDPVGNLFARKEGSTNKGAVMSGSHMDSVRNGGMFDGALGVIAAIEAVRRMKEEGFRNERPIEVAVFMGEEGSALKKALLGSSILIGDHPLKEAYILKNDDGVTLRQILIDQEYLGDYQFYIGDVTYFVETHIEQGPVLDQEEVSIGIVESITGLTWMKVVIKGQENHAGTTPMSMRVDPLVAAADVVRLTNRRASELASQGGSTVATVGRLVVYPSAPNVIPGWVELGIDIRDTQVETKRKLTDEIVDEVQRMENVYGIKVDVETLFDHEPCPLSDEVIDVIRMSSEDVGISYRLMDSGAGHDAQNIAKYVKTGLIFVPSVGGVSHSPLEWTHWDDIENGVKVLTESLKRLSMM